MQDAEKTIICGMARQERTSFVHPLAAAQRISLKILIAEIVIATIGMCFLVAKTQFE